MSTTRCRILIGVSITTINKLVGIGSIVAASGSVPPQQAVVGDKEVKAREREVLSVGIARQWELVSGLDNRGTVVFQWIEITFPHLIEEIESLVGLIIKLSSGGA